MIENTSSSSTKKKRILVVDDERDITESIKSVVKDRYWVDTAGNALDGLRSAALLAKITSIIGQ